MKVGNIIAGKTVETISSTATINELTTALKNYKVGALVVSDDSKKILGIVSERDVVRALPGKLDMVETLQVYQIMTADVHTCNSDTTIEELMKTMTERRIRHIPVVDEKDELISIISIGDVVKYYVGEIELERQSLKEYITGSH